MIYQPVSPYVITRQLYNLRDFGQKFVKAWVRDASTDTALLDGAEMTESADDIGRFKYDYTLPADSLGTGRQLRIITVVYTDNGYTERDVNYNVEENIILVRDLQILGGGGAYVDYEMIAKLVKDEIAKIKPVKIPELPDVKKLIKDAVKAVSEQIQGIEMPDIPKIIEKEVLVWQKPEVIEKEMVVWKEPDDKKLIELKNTLKKIQESLDKKSDTKLIKETIKETPDDEVRLLLNEILDKLDAQEQ